MPPRLALQSKWPIASANIEERKDVCDFRFRINRNHLPFLSVPLYSLYFPWISVLHQHTCWLLGFLVWMGRGPHPRTLELYKREMCRKPWIDINSLYLHILYSYIYICLYNTRHCRICPSLACKEDLQVTHQNQSTQHPNEDDYLSSSYVLVLHAIMIGAESLSTSFQFVVCLKNWSCWWVAIDLNNK